MTKGILHTGNIYSKLEGLDSTLQALANKEPMAAPNTPARDVDVLTPGLHPPKKGLSLQEGQARLLHDLANIELQAMELGVRSLINFPKAPEQFREELSTIVNEEAHHLQLCLEGIEKLGYKWGDWPIHTDLWDCTSHRDSFLDRIVIVHCYLEGSGLDAGDTILRKLSGVNAPESKSVVKVISQDEIAHVQFGTKWYLRICQQQHLDAERDFPERLQKLAHILPTRRERINNKLRQRAGFLPTQIDALESLQRGY